MGRRARATRREVSFGEHSKQVPAAPPRGLALGATPPAPAAIGRLPSPSPTAPHPHPLPTPARAALGAEQHGIVNLESLPYYANIQYSIVITNAVTRTLMSASSPPTHNTPSSHPLARRSGGEGACDPLTPLGPSQMDPAPSPLAPPDRASSPRPSPAPSARTPSCSPCTTAQPPRSQGCWGSGRATATGSTSE